MPYAPCTLHCIGYYCYYHFYNGWPAKIGLVPFWQPCSLCFVAVIVQCYIFVVLWTINLLSRVLLVNGDSEIHVYTFFWCITLADVSFAVYN